MQDPVQFQASTTFLQLLGKEVALMPGREILQGAKNPIPTLLVKSGRLKTKCIQVCVPCTTLSRFVFRQRQETMPISASTKRVFHPQQVNVEPIPVGFTDQAAHDLTVRCIQRKTEVFAAGITCLLYVVAPNALPNSFPYQVIRLINIDDLTAFTQRL